MADVIPYIDFVDRSREAVEFYKDVFGGDAEVQSDGQRVVHMDFRAGDIRLMGSDHQTDQLELAKSSQYALVLNCDSEEQLREFHAKLRSGGEELFAPVDSGWGSIASHCTDQFGVSWMLNYDTPQA